jgi:nitroreductase
MHIEIIDMLKSRRSIRKYKATPVEDEKLNTVLEAARWAPSAGNRQPWEFVVAKDPSTRRKIADVAPYGGFIADAPVMIAVVVDPRKDPTHCVEDGAIATTHLMLAAHALDLGTCWVGVFGSAYEDDAKRVLGVPPNLRVLSLVSLGYPAEERTSTRKDLREIMHCEKYGKKTIQ